MKDNSAFSQILKSNIVFGGIKVFQVLINILKTKLIAVFLGPSGVGIQTLLFSTISTIHQFSNLGIYQSSVREISINKEPIKKAQIIRILYIISIIIGVASSIICIIFSKFISIIIFQNPNYSHYIIICSISLLFLSITNAQISILQGLQKAKLLAKGSLLAAFISLITSFPLYYLFKTDAIPLVLTLDYIIFSISYYFILKVHKQPKVELTKAIFIKNANPILKMGINLMLSNCIMSLLNLLLNLYINRYGGSIDVGLYQAASICTYSAINIIVAILASDFFPRLSSNIENLQKTKEIVSIQIELLILILSPIICIINIFPHMLINLLYTSKFLNIVSAIQIMSISLFFRVIWHTMSYIILAKGDRKTYLIIDAILCNGLFFIFNIIGYSIYSVNGIAISYLLSSFIIMIILISTIYIKFKIVIDKYTYKVILYFLIICFLSFIINYSNLINSKLIANIIIMILCFSSILVIVNRKLSLFVNLKQ